ncbi:MAG: FkbM family methyltransferase [Candidatus Electryonea clarkiae]|nr:FkbM family methyltransferase [Candidatus Electryonea clarkiae]MDP8285975.1 FkbM family methyltransferase [Candidatus Electryonea clarkiae]
MIKMPGLAPMPTKTKSIQELAGMPWIQFFASAACNLSCEYCSQAQNHHKKVSENALLDPEVREFMADIPPTSIYVSGGEPLIHPGLSEFIQFVGEHGHIISFDTNLVINRNKLENLLGQCNPDHIGFINISHHLIENVGLDYILERNKIIQNAGIRSFVKYVGVPEFIPKIRENMKRLKTDGIGSAVSILQGKWRNRNLPHEYTNEEIYDLIELVTTNTHGLQFFDGIKSLGMDCRGGQDWLVYNQNEDKQFIPCCHGSNNPVNIQNTFFTNGDKSPKPCPIDTCLGDLMIILGLNGIANEVERFDKILDGDYEFVGTQSVVDFIEGIRSSGISLVNEKRYRQFLEFFENLPGEIRNKKKVEVKEVTNMNAVKSCSSVLAGNGNGNVKMPILDPAQSERVIPPPPPYRRDLEAIERFRKMNGDQVREELLVFISKWKTPEEVIQANPDMKSQLLEAADKLKNCNKAFLARSMAKVVAQHRFDLPRKINYEVTAHCVLRCEFCDLENLRKFRCDSRLRFEDFQKIWHYMEPFTIDTEFTGGEPLMNKEIYPMLNLVNQTGGYITLTSNAQLLNDKRAEKVLDAPPSRMLIAMDGVDKETYEEIRVRGNFEQLVENVQRIVRKRGERNQKLPLINLQMVVSKKNSNQMDDFYTAAAMLNVDLASVKPILIWPFSNDEFRNHMINEYVLEDHPFSYHKLNKNGELEDKRRKPGWCPNELMCHIGSGSEVIPCWYILKNTWIAGYAKETPFLEIWYSDEYMEYRRRMVQETVHEGCEGCIGWYDKNLFITKERDELQKEYNSPSDSLHLTFGESKDMGKTRSVTPKPAADKPGSLQETLSMQTADSLRQHIVERVPDLIELMKQQKYYQVVTKLREYANQTIIWSNDGLNAKIYAGGDLSKLAVEQLQFLFDSREIGTLCGGASIFLKKLYELFGFRAATYNYGIPGASTHVVTLVALPSGIGIEVVLQDASFNQTIVLNSPQSRDIRNILPALANGSKSNIDRISSADNHRELYFSDSNEGREYLRYYEEQNVLTSSPESFTSQLTGFPGLKVTGDMNYETSYLRRNGKKILPALSEHLGKPESECQVLELMRFPLNLTSFGIEELDEQLEQILESIKPVATRKQKFQLRENIPVISEDVPPPAETGWQKGLFGLYMLEESFSGRVQDQFGTIFEQEEYDPFVLELFSVLSILEAYPPQHINMFELGSGRAPWCLTLAGAVRFGFTNPSPTSCRVLALEGEPTHFRWSSEHLYQQNVPAVVVHGAIASKPGTARFISLGDPADWMGQSISSKEGTIEVYTFTIDQLMDAHGFDHLHLVHMDVQGQELEALKGARKALEENTIEHFVIGTHSIEIEEELKRILSPTHELVVELPQNSTTRIPGIAKLFRSTGDGVYVWRSKKL